ncbi:MAG TPA: 4Fe-4S dicluster domain-containing protein [Thermomicrobiales bacterium]|nr:4Fe-4S dicluster domain-containing protein [Thermomicrobiales bacterium]
MANYAFLIDQRTCIGCHACSVACKSENEVPLGVNRTWVKYVETGVFPDTRRHFQVTRCNHCANPPCVRICPVTAMYQRADGIVEFDAERCIGCKACLQACPYDAIYIDPETHSAAKCHFCAHRTDLGLEPACVLVCPTQSIIAGDLDDPGSAISRLVARHPVGVRKPEQGTAPKLFYIAADQTTLTPTAPATRSTYFWADVATDQARALATRAAATAVEDGADGAAGHTADGTALRVPPPQGLGTPAGPITVGGRVAEQMVQTAYTAQHVIPWHWAVPAYMVTKAIGAGAALALALAVGLRLAAVPGGFALAALVVALLFMAATTALLVMDLTHPERFFTVLTRPQWQSWLTRGTFILIAFAVLAGLWFLVELLGVAGAGGATVLRLPLAVLTFFAALASAVYTAFLFAQAEGRDLWQSPLMPVHLAVQALLVGAGALLVVGLAVRPTDAVTRLLIWFFLVGLVLDLFVTLVGEFGMPHASEVAALAAHEISDGRYRTWFWGGAIGLGHVAPLVLLLIGLLTGSLGALAALAALAGLCAIAGLYAFEYAFVMAPQEIPNS